MNNYTSIGSFVSEYKSAKNLLIILVFFLIMPFGAFLYAIYNYTKRESHIIMVLFTGLFAFSMQANSGGLDLYRVLETAKIYAAISSDHILSIVGGLYGSSDESGVDIYSDLMAFFVTRFSDNGHVLMLFYGLVYGWLYVKSLVSMLKVNNEKNIQTVFVLLSFSMIFSMDQIAGIRFGTASYLFFYGVFNYFLTKNTKYVFIAIMASFVHFSYISLILIFILFILFKPSNKQIVYIIIISFLAGALFKGIMINVFSFLGGSIEKRANVYIDAEVLNQDIVWYVAYREEMMTAFVGIFLFFTKVLKNKIIETQLSENLLKISLLFLALSNLTLFIPDAGYRFNLVFLFFFIAYVYTTYPINSKNVNFRFLYTLSLPFFLLQIFYAGRNILSYSPLSLYTISAPLIPFVDDTKTTWDYILSLIS